MLIETGRGTIRDSIGPTDFSSLNLLPVYIVLKFCCWILLCIIALIFTGTLCIVCRCHLQVRDCDCGPVFRN